MQYGPKRRALAGSVLVLGSMGTATAVHLDAASVPSSPDGRIAAATTPPAPPATRPATPDATSPSGDEPVLSAPRRGNRSADRGTAHVTRRPATTRDLIDIARGPRRGASVVLPVHDVERTVPLRSTSRAGWQSRLDWHDSDLQSLDDILSIGQGHGGHRYDSESGHSELNRWDFRTAGLDDSADYNHSTDYERYDDDGDYGSGRSGVGYHQADVRWDPGYSRSRCGRHRA